MSLLTSLIINRKPKSTAINIDGIRLTDGQAEMHTKVDDMDDMDHRLLSVTGPEVTSHNKQDSGPITVGEQEFSDSAADGPSVTVTAKGSVATVMAKGSMMTAKGSVAERSTSHKGGKTPTTGQPNGTRAIVEVLDRVDTPQLSATVDGDAGVGVDVGGRNFVGEPTAFSVLPDAGLADDRPCECPNCRRKPSRSTSSK